MAEDATLGIALLLVIGGATALLVRQCGQWIEEERHFSTPWWRIALTMLVVVAGTGAINLIGSSWLHATRGSLLVLDGVWFTGWFVWILTKVADIFRPRPR